MRWLSDDKLNHLRSVVSEPDFSATKYTFVKELGRGGMGAVCLAEDRELDRLVAIKVLNTPETTEDLRNRMVREAQIIARLEHPGIVPVHDVGTLPDGRIYYAMKYVRGSRLDEYAAQGAPLRDRLRKFQAVCDAVAFAHAHGVIHRDLKPQNVMVGPFGEVLVMDWGVAKLTAAPESLGVDAAVVVADGTSPTTGHGVVLGTPGYMAPEQATGDHHLIDARADVYAIGGILRDLVRCTGDHTDTPDSGKSARAPSRPLQAIIDRAMAAQPEHRYADVMALSRDVAALRAGEPVTAYRETVFERVRRFAVRHSTPILLVLAYLIMRVAFLAIVGR